MPHKLNLDKLKELLEKRGWHFNASLRHWEQPDTCDNAQAQKDWVECTEQAIECRNDNLSGR